MIRGSSLAKLVVTSCVVATYASEAHAGEPVSWEAEPGCPSSVDVRSALEEMGIFEGRSDARVSVAIRRIGGRFHAAIDVERDGTTSRRSLDAETCRLASDAAVVIVGMLAVAPKASDAAPEPSVPAAEPPDAEHDRAIMPAPEKSRLRSGLEGFVDSATLPAASPGLLATMTYARDRGELALGVGGTLPARGAGRTTLDGRVLGADVSLFLASARGEWRPSESGVLGGRAGLDVGVLHATGTGAWSPATSNAFWTAVSAGPTARWEIGRRVLLHAAVEAVVPLVRPTFVIDLDAVHRPAPVAARASLGVDLRW